MLCVSRSILSPSTRRGILHFDRTTCSGRISVTNVPYAPFLSRTATLASKNNIHPKSNPTLYFLSCSKSTHSCLGADTPWIEYNTRTTYMLYGMSGYI